MKKEVKYRVFPFYFPQFYATEENNLWWGKDFTDWDLVKKAQAISNIQCQPRVPMEGYYDQSLPDTIEWQSKLAKSYGISGFNFYHYWFDGKILLDKPIQNLLNNKQIDIEFMVTWANETWTRQWIGKPEDILIKQEHKADQDIWEKHYEYLRALFIDERYVKIKNAPVMCIYRAELIKSLSSWIEYMNCKAIEDGFSGMHFIAMRSYDIADSMSVYKYFDKIINFQPRYSINKHLKNNSNSRKTMEKWFRSAPEWLQLRIVSLLKGGRYNEYSYSDYLKTLENDVSLWNNKPVYQVAFPDWDNAPRYKERATFFNNISPENFGNALDIIKRKIKNHDDKFIFINAWNEWSEGAYLEPDETNKFKYLEVIKNKINL